MANPFKTIERAIMRLMSRVLPPCKDIAHLLSTGMDQKLPLRQRVAVRVHLVLCNICRRYRKQLHLIHHASAPYADPETNLAEEPLSPDAKTRLKQALSRRDR